MASSVVSRAGIEPTEVPLQKFPDRVAGLAGEAENGFRKAIAENADAGLKGISIGQSPGLVAIAMKAAISALEGNVMPQLISVPLPIATYDQLKDGVNYWSDLPAGFSTINEFPPCGVNITGPAIMAQDESDVK